MKLKIALTSLLSVLFISCEHDHDENTQVDSIPIVFSASIQPEPNARVTVNNGWVDMYDNRIGVSIDGETRVYEVSEIGELTSDNPFYWNGRESVYAEAWFPYNDGVKTETLWVYADQRIAENYEKSDYLEVLDTKVTPRRNKLVFKHRTSKVTCSYSAGGDEQANARFVLHGLQGVNEGNSVMMNAKHRAIIVPQTIPVGADFIELILDEKDHYFYTMEEELSVEGGFSYHTDITLDEETGELDVVFSKPSSWEAEIEIPEGESPESGTEGGNGGSWNGEGENSDGSSSESGTEGSNGGSWNGEGENSNGSSSESGTEGSNGGSWNGEGENSDGSSPESGTDSGTGGGWDSEEENSDGSSSESGINNGNSGWEGSEGETSNGDSPESGANGNGSWTEESENSTGNSSETNSNGNGSWDGENESSMGSSPESGANGNGSWIEDSENSTGNSTETNNSGNGSWDGENESSVGSSPESGANGNGSWIEDSEISTGNSTESNNSGNGSWDGEKESSVGSSPESGANGNGTWTEEKETATNNNSESNASGNGKWTQEGETESVTGILGSIGKQSDTTLKKDVLITKKIRIIK